MKIEHPAAKAVLVLGRTRDGGMVVTLQDLGCEPDQSAEIVLDAEEVEQVAKYFNEAIERARALRRGGKGRAFECQPSRAGWIVGWVADGVELPQYPHLRVEANTRLELRALADSCVAVLSGPAANDDAG